jgi:hypothetical protein
MICVLSHIRCRPDNLVVGVVYHSTRTMADATKTNGENGNAFDVSYRDPSVYSQYEQKWPLIPEDEPGWIQRAQEVADILAVDAALRDKENKSPRAEVALLKHAGLLKVLGPRKYGGGGQPWSVGE